jgi:hypothetical protein
MQPQSMMSVVDGKRYRTDTATLLAHDEYWNGHTYEQNGRNTFLFRTRNGNYFAQHQTLLPVITAEIVPLDESGAMTLYHSLYRKEVPFVVAFPCVRTRDA